MALLGLTVCGLSVVAHADSPAEIAAADRAKTTVCTDGKSHYVALAPDERLIYALFYSDGKQWYRVPAEE